MGSSAPHVVVVRNQCGPHCITREDAESLFNHVLPLLRADDVVSFDFTGVETLASSFLNVAVARLYGQFDAGFVDEHLRWSGLDEADDSLMSLVIRNAKDHYRKTAAERAREAEIIRHSREKDE